MALVHMTDMLRHAYENQYAVGAFDVINLDMLHGVIKAAEASRAPVIIGIAEQHLGHFDLASFAPAVETAARLSRVPVAVHLDHATTLDTVIDGIRHGCNSFMIDGSNLELQGNIDLTKDAVKIARACGVAVEAEMGYVPEDGGELVYTSAAEAQGFVNYTEVDSLAVSIGTVHGRFKGKPKLDFARLRQINEALGIPLVLHGSSGLTDDQFHRLIANGIAKINYFTALTDQAAQLLRDNAKDKTGSYLTLFTGVRALVEDEAARLMRTWGSAGRAAEVLTQCRPWNLIDHIIKFNLPDSDAQEAAHIVTRGRQILAQIPGIRDVVVSEALSAGEQHQYRLIMRVTAPEVIDQVNDNADFRKYLGRYLSPHNTDLVIKTYRQGQPA